MFDPNSYKDEWTKNNTQNNTAAAAQPIPVTATQQTTMPVDNQQSPYDSFHHFDGTKAEVSGNLTQKFNENLARGSQPENNDNDLESEADEIINATTSTPEDIAADENQSTKEQLSDDTEVVDDMPETKQAINNTNLTEMEKALLDKSSAAKAKIDEKITGLKQELEKLNSEITTLNLKKDELDKLANDLKDKLHQFDEEVSEI